MRKFLLLFPMLFFLTANARAEIAPVKVIGATTVDTMFAKGLWDKGNITFIDVRKEADYKAGHIPKAKHLSLDNLTSESLSAVVKKDQPVLFYCNGVTCTASSQAVKKALEWGWTSVFYYRKGMPAWKGAALEVEK